MGHRSIRFPDDLEERLLALAESERRSFSNLVVSTLEKALDGHAVARPAGQGDASREAGAEKAPRSPSVVPAPPQAPETSPTGRKLTAAYERQMRLNKAKGL